MLVTMPFGVFADIEGQPDALALMEITTLPRGGELPAGGVWLDAVVVDHAAHNWQVRLRPGGTQNLE
ncbi:hypothetical protein [Micromonospora noduli]|uniref:hypothetical protein n=1 Tax=Micromonospora noduli TaxID=709876 RepID=UPI0021AC61C5|nr:hypothetical protein [Micromonospora noduli]